MANLQHEIGQLVNWIEADGRRIEDGTQVQRADVLEDEAAQDTSKRERRRVALLRLSDGPWYKFLLTGVLICGAAASFAQTETTPGSSAQEKYISSLYGYHLAKISLARARGVAEEGVKEYFKGQ